MSIEYNRLVVVLAGLAPEDEAAVREAICESPHGQFANALPCRFLRVRDEPRVALDDALDDASDDALDDASDDALDDALDGGYSVCPDAEGGFPRGDAERLLGELMPAGKSAAGIRVLTVSQLGTRAGTRALRLHRSLLNQLEQIAEDAAGCVALLRAGPPPEHEGAEFLSELVAIRAKDGRRYARQFMRLFCLSWSEANRAHSCRALECVARLCALRAGGVLPAPRGPLDPQDAWFSTAVAHAPSVPMDRIRGILLLRFFEKAIRRAGGAGGPEGDWSPKQAMRAQHEALLAIVAANEPRAEELFRRMPVREDGQTVSELFGGANPVREHVEACKERALAALAGAREQLAKDLFRALLRESAAAGFSAMYAGLPACFAESLKGGRYAFPAADFARRAQKGPQARPLRPLRALFSFRRPGLGRALKQMALREDLLLRELGELSGGYYGEVLPCAAEVADAAAADACERLRGFSAQWQRALAERRPSGEPAPGAPYYPDHQLAAAYEKVEVSLPDGEVWKAVERCVEQALDAHGDADDYAKAAQAAARAYEEELARLLKPVLDAHRRPTFAGELALRLRLLGQQEGSAAALLDRVFAYDIPSGIPLPAPHRAHAHARYYLFTVQASQYDFVRAACTGAEAPAVVLEDLACEDLILAVLTRPCLSAIL